MKDPVYKLIELTGTSTASIEEAVDKAVKRHTKPSKTCAGFRWSKHAATSPKEKCITGR
jgi:flavin-binding protein dodecin